MLARLLKRTVYIGCQHVTDFRLIRSLVLINSINIAALTACLGIFLFYVSLGRYSLSLTCFPVMLVYGTIYFLNYFERFRLSKFLFMLTTNVSVLFGAIMLGHGVTMSIFYFTALAITYIIYASHERRSLLFFTTLSMGLFIAVELLGERYLPGFLPMEPGQQKALRLVLIVFDIGVLAFACYLMHAASDKLEDLLFKEEEGKVDQVKLSALGVMSAGIAHEINNPLAIVTSRIEQIIDLLDRPDVSDERLIQLLENVQKNAQRIGKIVRSLRSFTRSAAKTTFEPCHVDLLIADSLELCRESLNRESVALRYGACPDNLEILCHPSEIMQVIINLVQNAVDAIAAYPDKWVAIDVTADSKDVTVRVTDSGPGIPKELQTKIMQPFFTTERLGKGTGLGLSISMTLIENHGGRLFLDTTSPHTSFVIRLPRLRRGASEAIPAPGAA